MVRRRQGSRKSRLYALWRIDKNGVPVAAGQAWFLTLYLARRDASSFCEKDDLGAVIHQVSIVNPAEAVYGALTKDYTTFYANVKFQICDVIPAYTTQTNHKALCSALDELGWEQEKNMLLRSWPTEQDNLDKLKVRNASGKMHNIKFKSVFGQGVEYEDVQRAMQQADVLGDDPLLELADQAGREDHNHTNASVDRNDTSAVSVGLEGNQVVVELVDFAKR